jgi:hypothetical protein
LEEEEEAEKDLLHSAVLESTEIAPVLGQHPELRLVHRRVRDGTSTKVRAVSRWDLLADETYLARKAGEPHGAEWFRRLYLWLQRNPSYETYLHRRKPRLSVRGYHNQDFILTSDCSLLKGGEVSVFQIPEQVGHFISDLARDAAAERPMLHPAILADDQSDILLGFLRGLTGVQVLDAKTVCREKVLPRILVTQPAPAFADLVDYAKICKQLLGTDLGGAELWVATKSREVRPGREVILPPEFDPLQDWETHQQYVSGLHFVHPSYLGLNTSDDDRISWRKFFKAGGVKDAPDNGVEEFAMNYALAQLGVRWRSVIPIDKRNFGYDIDAETDTGEHVQVEVKGCTEERDIELTPNETLAADKYRRSFLLCVVCGIPDQPRMYVLPDPADAGKKDKITVLAAVWKERRWEL